MDTYDQVETRKHLLERYMKLPLPPNTTQCMYVYIDGTGEQLCAKSRTLNFVPHKVEDVPLWVTCTFPTFSEDLSNCEIYLHPVALYNDPFRGGDNKLVLCETYNDDNTPTKTNHRKLCLEAMEKAASHDPWFGFEQEYMLLNNEKLPLGGLQLIARQPTGMSYFGVGAEKIFGREILEAHYRSCLYAGISLAGTNIEFMPSQFEFQIGICKGVKIGDDLWMARFILQRLAEDFGITVTFDPKPFPSGNWLGSGCHANFSTNKMRAENGIVEIEKAIERLAKNHQHHIKAYDPKQGKDNFRRLTGGLATPDFDKFEAGVSSRNGSVRIPNLVAKAGKGYLEDRRPSSNCDPYKVAEALVRTICLQEEFISDS